MKCGKQITTADGSTTATMKKSGKVVELGRCTMPKHRGPCGRIDHAT